MLDQVQKNISNEYFWSIPFLEKRQLFEVRGGTLNDSTQVLRPQFIGGSLELPMWLTDGFLVTFWWLVRATYVVDGRFFGHFFGGSSELPMWLTGCFLVTFFGRWRGAVRIHVSHV